MASKGAKPGTLISTPVFDGADEDEIHKILENVNANRDGKQMVNADGKTTLYDQESKAYKGKTSYK